MKKLVSVVVPVYNEEGNVQRLMDRVTSALKSEEDRYDFEFVFTDNHSQDLTFTLLQEMAFKDSRIRAYRFSRNFGFQRSILSGYRLARGEAAVQIDCDLQDPPEIIPTFLRKWEEGFAVVYGIRAKRPESLLMQNARRFFYRLVDFLADDRLPHDAGDFRLIDRCVLNIVTRINDTQPYLRGVIASAGFAQTGVIYDRDERRAGKSKFGLLDLVELAVDAITNHSVIPLKLASLMGVLITVASLLGFVYYLLTSLFLGNSWPRGFATLILVLLFLSGVNALFLGVIGEYIGRIYHQIKVRPNAIVEAAIEQRQDIPREGLDSINSDVC
ncbi:MAG TPA: glycosyltransferase family 2 protein [Dongiaceae bacterium]|nr:glycosyltransferase family 2 protein [Dongiaceae bacterium]